MRIWAPCPPSKKQLAAWRAAGGAAEDKPRTFFKTAAVFTQAQLEPMPGSDPVSLDAPAVVDLAGDALQPAIAPMCELAEQLGVAVLIGSTRGGCDGFYRHAANLIVLSETLASANARASTLLHELAHALVARDRQDDDPDLDYAREELVAESVAFIVAAGLGVDTAAQSIPYLASWAERAPADTLQATAGLIDRLAQRLEEALTPQTHIESVAA